MVSAFFSLTLSFSVSLWSLATSCARGFLLAFFRPRFLGDMASNSPFSFCFLHVFRFDEYNPSSRRKAPRSPGCVHLSAFSRMSSLYLAVNFLRGFFSGTSGSGTGGPLSSSKVPGGGTSGQRELIKGSRLPTEPHVRVRIRLLMSPLPIDRG